MSLLIQLHSLILYSYVYFEDKTNIFLVHIVAVFFTGKTFHEKREED